MNLKEVKFYQVNCSYEELDKLSDALVTALDVMSDQDGIETNEITYQALDEFKKMIDGIYR